MGIIALPRRWVRHLTKLVFGIALLLILLFIVDNHYNILPPSFQSRLLMQSPGHVVVDIKVESCFLKSSCPQSSKDGWYRVPKELGLGKRWSQSSFVYVKRVDEKTLEAGSNVVLDAAVADPKLSTSQPPPHVIKDVSPETDTESVKLSDVSNAGWVKRDHGLWIKLGKGRAQTGVTAVDVLFGEDAVDPRLSWRLDEGYIDGLASQPRL